jgi:hypothetical protein
MKLGSNNKKIDDKKLFSGIRVILVFVWCLSFLNPLIFGTKRYISDYIDINAYFGRAKWVVTHEAAVSEYPQIPTYLFGLNEFIAGFFDVSIRFLIFYSIIAFEMIVVLYFFIKILYESFPSDRKYRSLLMLLPPTLYFVINRFDILPALLCLIALKMTQEKKWIPASIILALATFTKWYPVLIFPGFFVYASTQEHKYQWKIVVVFLMTSLFIILPTYFQGGIDAVLFPYQFHVDRGMEFVAFPLLINHILLDFADISISQQYFFLFFFVLQILPPLLAIFLKINTLERLVKYCIIVISMFILFSRVNSPQWYLWLLPFLIISIKNKTDVWIIVLYNIAAYLFFPVVFDLFGPASIQLQVLGISSYLILATIIMRSFKDMSFSKKPILSKGYLD